MFLVEGQVPWYLLKFSCSFSLSHSLYRSSPSASLIFFFSSASRCFFNSCSFSFFIFSAFCFALSNSQPRKFSRSIFRFFCHSVSLNSITFSNFFTLGTACLFMVSICVRRLLLFRGTINLWVGSIWFVSWVLHRLWCERQVQLYLFIRLTTLSISMW